MGQLSITPIDPFAPKTTYPTPGVINDLVTDGWAKAQGYADEAFSSAQTHLQTLVDTAASITELPSISLPSDPVMGEVAAFIMPPSPLAPDTTANFPQAPQDPTLTAVAPIEVGSMPSFDVVTPVLDLDIAPPDALQLTLPDAPNVRDFTIPDAPQEPTLTTVSLLELGAAPEFTATAPVLDLDIALPTPLAVSAPVAPVLGEVAIPATPEIDLPAVPSMRDVVIPTAPAINLPQFAATLGDAPVSMVPEFSFVEESYTSDLLSTMRARLTEWVGGTATGLSPDVEAALWNRGRDREQTAGAQLAQDALRAFAVRGFTRPPGALAVALQKASESVMDKSLTLSRDIAIKQAELEQANRQFAFTTAWQIESGLLSYAGQIATRALDAAKFASDLGVRVFLAEVQRYQAETAAFTGRAEVYKALLQAELSRLDIFRSEIEAQKLVGEVNQQQVQLYSARVGAAGQIIELFRAGVQASQAVAEVQKTRIQAFGTEVQAFGEQVRAKGSEYDMYATRVKAEVSKAETFKISTDAYSSQVQGYAAVSRAMTEQKNLEIDVSQRLPMDMFKARTEGFKSVVSGLQAASEIDRTRIQLYSAQTQALDELVKANAQNVDIFRAKLDSQRIKADTFGIQANAYGTMVTAFKTNVDAMVAKTNADIRINQELPLEIYKTRAISFDSLVRAESERLKSITSTYEVNGRLFESAVKGESARVGADTDVFKATTDANVKSAELELRAAEANVQMVRDKLSMLIEAVKAGAQVSAQLAASSLSGINMSGGASLSYGAHISDNNSNSYNYSESQSESESTSYNHNISE